AAVAAAEHAGVRPDVAVEALSRFQGVKRRMEKYGEVAGISLYDDFAHHPTAIETTLGGICNKVAGRVLAVLEPRSNTMKMGVHKDTLANSVKAADKAYWYLADIKGWQLDASAGEVYTDIEQLVKALVDDAKSGDHIVM